MKAVRLIGLGRFALCDGRKERMSNEWEPRPRSRVVVYVDRERQENELYRRLQQLADSKGTSVSRVILRACEWYLSASRHEPNDLTADCPDMTIKKQGI